MKKTIRILEIALALVLILANISFADVMAPAPTLGQIISDYLPIVGIIIAVVIVLAAVYAVIKANEDVDESANEVAFAGKSPEVGSAPTGEAPVESAPEEKTEAEKTEEPKEE